MSLITSSRKTSRRAYERYAWLYDRSRVINYFLKEWDRKFISLEPKTPLLDLGCATGRLASTLAANGMTDIVGIDLSLSGLKIARGKMKGIPFLQAQIEELPFKEGYFSSAIFSGVIHHLEDAGFALDEVRRVLKPGGLLYISEPYFWFGIRHIVNAVLDIYPLTGDRRFYSPERLFALGAKHGFRKKEGIVRLLSYILVLERC